MGSISASQPHADTAFPMNPLIVLSAPAVRPHVPRMWALDLAQEAGRKGRSTEVAGVSARGCNGPDDLARQLVTQLLLATVLSSSKQPRN